MVRSSWAHVGAILFVAWGCSSTSSNFGDEVAGRGGTNQGGKAGSGGTSGVGGVNVGGANVGGANVGGANVGGAGGIGGSVGGAGGKGGAGGSPAGAGGAQGGTAGADTGGVGAEGGVGAVGGDPLGGTSGSGLGGTAGAAVRCLDPDATAGPTYNGASVASTTEGTNGTFADACDANGNLIEYSCQTACAVPRINPTGGVSGFGTGGVGAGGGAVCIPAQSGTVTSQTIDCGGACAEGACFGWCADIGDEFVVTSAASTGLSVERDGFAYVCSVAFQLDGYDCLSASLNGRTITVTSLGACSGASTTFGWNDPESTLGQECAFTCSLM